MTASSISRTLYRHNRGELSTNMSYTRKPAVHWLLAAPVFLHGPRRGVLSLLVLPLVVVVLRLLLLLCVLPGVIVYSLDFIPHCPTLNRLIIRPYSAIHHLVAC